jgi:hypothetical protein
VGPKGNIKGAKGYLHLSFLGNSFAVLSFLACTAVADMSSATLTVPKRSALILNTDFLLLLLRWMVHVVNIDISILYLLGSSDVLRSF